MHYIQRQITRKWYIYNGGPIDCRIWFIEWHYFQWSSMILTWFSRSHHSLTLHISQTATDTATVTIEGE